MRVLLPVAKKTPARAILRLPLSPVRSYNLSPTAVPKPSLFEYNKNASLCNQPKKKPLTKSFICTCNLPHAQFIDSRLAFVTFAGEEVGKPSPEGNQVAALPSQADLQAEAYQACRQGKALAVQ